MTVDAIAGVSYYTEETNPYTMEAGDVLDKMDFLNLLTAQLQNQDPLDPQDPTEFTSQLTQFSNLEQMINLNEAVESLQVLQLSTNNTMATSLIGRELVYAGDSFKIGEGEAPELQFYADTKVDSATVHIYDESHTLVRTINVSVSDTGLNRVEWNGRTGDSDTDPLLADGTYTFAVSGTDAGGNSVKFQTLSSGLATGVIFEDGITYLQVNGERIQLGEIFSVNQTAGGPGSDGSDDDIAADTQGRTREGASNLSLANVAKVLATTAVKLSPLFL